MPNTDDKKEGSQCDECDFAAITGMSLAACKFVPDDDEDSCEKIIDAIKHGEVTLANGIEALNALIEDEDGKDLLSVLSNIIREKGLGGVRGSVIED